MKMVSRKRKWTPVKTILQPFVCKEGTNVLNVMGESSLENTDIHTSVQAGQRAAGREKHSSY